MKHMYLIIALSTFFAFNGYARKTVSTVKPLTSEEFQKIIASKTVTLIDVRTAEEFSDGHIPGAVNLDVNNPDFVSSIEKLIKKKPLALYCRSGNRSKLAAAKLSKLKIKIYELNLGIKDWIQAGFPVTKE
ncbi:MAG: rhodanese-like domain-containing protein [Paludibacter sp.]